MEGLCERDGTMGSGEDDLLVFADEDPGTHPKYPDETIVRNTAEQTINRMIRTIEIAEREIPLRIAAISAEDFYHDSRGRENHESPLFRQLARFGAILGVSREPHVSCFMDEDGGRSGVFTYEWLVYTGYNDSTGRLEWFADPCILDVSKGTVEITIDGVRKMLDLLNIRSLEAEGKKVWHSTNLLNP